VNKRFVLVLGAAVAVACSSTNETRRLVARRTTTMDTPTSANDHRRCDATRPGRSFSEYDTNGDGVPDVRKVYQTQGEGAEVHSVLICREVDLNHDGTKDVFRFYNEEGRTLHEEEDRDFNGTIDVVTYFENGEVVRREFDQDRDGMVDMRLFFRDHRPFRAEREMQTNNSPEFRADYWEFYDTRGHVVRIGWDYDHDGRADRWDRVDRVAPIAAQPAPVTPEPAATPATTPAAPATPGGGASTPTNTAPGAAPSSG
jgi:hypothetical protein